jgi:hypothetical protein
VVTSGTGTSRRQLDIRIRQDCLTVKSIDESLTGQIVTLSSSSARQYTGLLRIDSAKNGGFGNPTADDAEVQWNFEGRLDVIGVQRVHVYEVNGASGGELPIAVASSWHKRVRTTQYQGPLAAITFQH